MYPDDDDPYGSLRLAKSAIEVPPAKAPKTGPVKTPAAPSAPPAAKREAAPPAPATPKAVAPQPGRPEFRRKYAGDIAQHFELGAQAKELLGDGQMNPWQYLRLLIEKEQYTDASRFLSYALPPREGAWWACLCARSGYGPKAEGPAEAALQAAEKWVADPTDERRRAAFPAAEAAGMGTPAGCAALAAFWSGGSLAPAGLDPVPPKEFLGAIPVAGAVMLATVLSEPHKAPEKYRRFLALGIEVATGSNRWK